jgi:hypothetical protein
MAVLRFMMNHASLPQIVSYLLPTTRDTSGKLDTWQYYFRSLLEIRKGTSQSLTEIVANLGNVIVKLGLGFSSSSPTTPCCILPRW